MCSDSQHVWIRDDVHCQLTVLGRSRPDTEPRYRFASDKRSSYGLTSTGAADGTGAVVWSIWGMSMFTARVRPSGALVATCLVGGGLLLAVPAAADSTPDTAASSRLLLQVRRQRSSRSGCVPRSTRRVTPRVMSSS